MQNDNSRNTITFIVLTMAMMLAYNFLIVEPAAKRRQQELAMQHAAATAAAAPQAPGVGLNGFVSREDALAQTPRVAIDTPTLKGSISLTGATFDDLYLKKYRVDQSKNAPPVELFRPAHAEFAYFAQTGWTGQNIADLPNQKTVWTQVTGSTLSPGQPVTLGYTSASGLKFTRTIAIDQNYVFSIVDRVQNTGTGQITLEPFSRIIRQGLPKTANGHELGKDFAHEGAVGVVQGNQLKMFRFQDWAKKDPQLFDSTGGWLGMTDKYWLAAFISGANDKIKANMSVSSVAGVAVFDSGYVGEARSIAPGATATSVTHLFAGAKQSELLTAYSKTLDAPRLNDAIDWGSLWFLTKPYFWLVDNLFHLVGNFGWAIVLSTIVVRALTYPLAHTSYASMQKMKDLAPKLEALKAKYGSDQMRYQQEMMALQKAEKVNPVAGCLPMLLTIPVFIALAKVLQITLEMRQAPFIGWITDLSSPDPTTIFNLFGLLPYDPSAVPVLGGLLGGALHIGVWPILYAGSMALQQSLNPPVADPMQRKIMTYMPLVYLFMLSAAPVGLIIYYSWSGVITVVQQYIIMKAHKAQNPIDDFFARLMGKPVAATGPSSANIRVEEGGKSKDVRAEVLPAAAKPAAKPRKKD